MFLENLSALNRQKFFFIVLSAIRVTSKVIEVVYYVAFEYCFESHDDLHDSISSAFLFRFVHWASSRLFRCLRLMSVFDLDESKCYELIL